MLEQRLRVATWNLARPQTAEAPRAEAIARKLREVDADIWILTETHLEASPGADFIPVASQAIAEGFTEGERRTIIWSRLPVVDVIATHDAETAVCVAVEAALGTVLVYGTIIPYQHAGTGKKTYRSGGVDVSGQKGWQLHYESIERHRADLLELANRFPSHAICFGGDFNQSRDGRVWTWGRQWYGTHQGRELLGSCLDEAGMICVTEQDFTAMGKLPMKSSIDHLCFTRNWAAKVVDVDVWLPELIGNKPVSDHNGIFVDLSL